MKYSLVIFDLDGTILDTLQDLTNSINYALSMSKLPVHSKDEVRRFVGNGIPKLIERAIAPCSDEQIKAKVYADFTEYYTAHCSDFTVPYQGITDLLSNLNAHNIKLAVASNKDDYAVKNLCTRYFGNLFDFVIGRHNGIPAKPAPDMVQRILDSLNIDKSKSIYIGDSDVDIKTASNIGINCITVSWGFKDIDFLKSCGATCIVNDTQQLLNKLI